MSGLTAQLVMEEGGSGGPEKKGKSIRSAAASRRGEKLSLGRKDLAGNESLESRAGSAPRRRGVLFAFPHSRSGDLN